MHFFAKKGLKNLAYFFFILPRLCFVFCLPIRTFNRPLRLSKIVIAYAIVLKEFSETGWQLRDLLRQQIDFTRKM